MWNVQLAHRPAASMTRGLQLNGDGAGVVGPVIVLAWEAAAPAISHVPSNTRGVEGRIAHTALPAAPSAFLMPLHVGGNHWVLAVSEIDTACVHVCTTRATAWMVLQPPPLFSPGWRGCRLPTLPAPAGSPQTRRPHSQLPSHDRDQAPPPPLTLLDLTGTPDLWSTCASVKPLQHITATQGQRCQFW